MQGRPPPVAGPKYNHPIPAAVNCVTLTFQRRRDTPERGGRCLSRVRNPELSGFSLWEERHTTGATMYGTKEQHPLRKRVETPWRDKKSASG
jgi:hypothetical protein